MKRIFALLIAVLMLMSCFAALADDDLGAPAENPPTNETTTPVNNLTKDTTISVSGLDNGDTVDFYQILKYDQNAVTTGGWVATSDFAYDETNNPNGLTVAMIQKMLNLGTDGKPVDLTKVQNPETYGITAELAAQLADIAEASSVDATYADVAAVASGEDYVASVTKSNDDDKPIAGLYMALVTAGQPATLYNPVFVGADYFSNESNGQEAVTDLSYSNNALAKKSTITLEKTASTSEEAYEDGEPETVAVGDTVNFTVVTKIPAYGNNYTNAVFNVVDTLSEGLELNTSSIKVYLGKGNELTEINAGNNTFAIMNKGLTADIKNTDKDGYGVKFATAYILGDGRGKDITITYSAKVTTDAPFSVNLEKNTVEVHFSNNPTDSTGAGRLKDETKHYTFDIDGDILGEEHGNWPTTEVVKIGLDAEGKELYKVTTTLHQGQSKVGALEGATFKLYYADQNGTLSIKDSNGDSLTLTQYTNDVLTAEKVIVSDKTGRLTIQGEKLPGIRGLDIGTYYLVEESAPAGYIKCQTAVKVEIIAPKPEAGKDGATEDLTENDYWKLVDHSEQLQDDEFPVTWKVWELKKYRVEINGIETASYQFKNKNVTDPDEYATYGDGDIISTKTDIVTGADLAGLIGEENATAAAAYGKIPNTQGVELPHTGGIGTTLFYIGGSILVLAAVILLVTKRRMGGND